MSSMLVRSRWLAASLLAVYVVACGDPQAASVARETDRGASRGNDAAAVAASWCREGGRVFVDGHYGNDVRFVAAHPTTVAAFEAWAETRHRSHGPETANETGVDEFAALCVYDGDFSQIPKGPPQGLERDEYTRLSVIATGPGEFRLYEVGDARVMDASYGPPAPPPGLQPPVTVGD